MAKKKTVAESSKSELPADYAPFLESLKNRVKQSQTKAMLSVNRELIQLYWDIGRLIVERQEREGWGQSVIDRISGDIQKAFPGIEGFSSSNISRMRAFFRAYRWDQEDSAQPVPKLAGKKSAQLVPKSVARKVIKRQMGPTDHVRFLVACSRPYGEAPTSLAWKRIGHFGTDVAPKATSERVEQ